MMSGYNFNHTFRGTALIIGNEFLGQGSGERKGCLNDIQMAQDFFRRLDFNVEVYMNLPAVKMKEKMERASKNLKNIDSDCFVLVISSHGHETKSVEKNVPKEATVWRHQVLAEDNVAVYVDEIIEIFSDENSVGLKGKPRLFFIQACKSRRGDGNTDVYDPGVEVNVIQELQKLDIHTSDTLGRDHKDSTNSLYDIDLTDAEDIYSGWRTDPDLLPIEARTGTSEQATDQDAAGEFTEIDSGGSGDSGQMPPSPFDIVPIKCPEDFLIMYPVMSGKYAFRNANTGSYLIKFLHDNLAHLLQGCNILLYLTYVCHEMASYEYNPNLELILERNKRLEREATLSGRPFDPLSSFKNHLYGTIKFLIREENLEKLVSIVGEEHRNNLKKDPAISESYIRKLISAKLTAQQMIYILKKILPFKMTACIVHRLADDVNFKPKREKSMMGILWKKMLPKSTSV